MYKLLCFQALALSTLSMALTVTYTDLSEQIDLTSQAVIISHSQNGSEVTTEYKLDEGLTTPQIERVEVELDKAVIRFIGGESQLELPLKNGSRYRQVSLRENETLVGSVKALQVASPVVIQGSIEALREILAAARYDSLSCTIKKYNPVITQVARHQPSLPSRHYRLSYSFRGDIGAGIGQPTECTISFR